MRIAFLSTVVAALLVAQPARAAAPERVQTLKIDGRASATPYLAAQDGVVVAVWTASGGGSTDLYAAVSRDRGGSFGLPVRVNDRLDDVDVNGEQPPRATIVPGSGGRGIAVLWTSKDPAAGTALRFSRSTDGGRTFSRAVTIHATGLPGPRGWQSLAAGPDGTLHALWLDSRVAMKSDGDPAARHETEKHGAHPGHHGHQTAGHAMSGGAPVQELFYARVTSTGGSAERRLVTNVCFCCKTSLVVDAKGTMFAAWRHIYPGSQRDIAVARSTDGGRTFAEPVRVSDDQWELDACPDDGPSAAVDGAGRLHIAWPTLVPGDEPAIGIFYASSPDGREFTARRRLDLPNVMDPSHPQLAVTADGAVAVLWDEIKDGTRRVVARTAPAGSRGSFGDPMVLSSGVASYPVVAPVGEGFLVAWTSGMPDESVIQIRQVEVGAARTDTARR